MNALYFTVIVRGNLTDVAERFSQDQELADVDFIAKAQFKRLTYAALTQ